MCATSERSMTSLFGLFFIVLLSALMDNAEACGGTTVKIKSIANCPGTVNLVNLHNIAAEVDDNCKVKTHGCVETDGFKGGKVTYKISKNGVTMLEGTENLCRKITEGSKEAMMLDLIGFPHECPAGKFKVCLDDKEINIDKFKTYLGLARGKIEVDINIKHDNGSTCVKAKAVVSK